MLIRIAPKDRGGPCGTAVALPTPEQVSNRPSKTISFSQCNSSPPNPMPIAADAPAPSGDPQVAAERAGRDAGPRRDFALKYRNWRVIRELAPRGLYMRRQSLIGLLTLALFLSAAQVFTLDGVTGLIAPVLFRTDTRYAAGYADSAFRRVRKGMEDKDVRATLGDPLEEVWDYSRDGVDCGLIFITGSSVTAVSTAHKSVSRR